MFVVTFVLLLIVNIALSTYFWDINGDNNAAVGGSPAVQAQYKNYVAFRNNYLTVYLSMMMADWLQGPYVYALYKHYGFGIDEIGYLFIAGFLSSAIFGTVISSLADRYGRKKMCLAFSVIYIASCITKFSSSFYVLMLGRLLGGVSTSLLFSVFEAWLVSEHHSRHFPEEWLSTTFSWATYGNGFVAIMSGVIANVVVDMSKSFVAPFVVSALFLAFGGFVVYTTWKENYGDSKISLSSAERDHDQPGGGSWWNGSLIQGFQSIRSDFQILSVGMMVALFEGSMYTFVFLWGPVLESGYDGRLPYGLIFATFMVCIMMGSIAFRWALSKGYIIERIIMPLLLVAAFAMFIPMFSSSILTFLSFNLFEVCCGVYFPTMGSIRSKYVPEQTRATVMNIFRVPLNLIVVLVLLNVSTMSYSTIFGVCTVLLCISYGFAAALHRRVQK